MSVEVKTPTRNQFEHTEFPCGEKQLSSGSTPPNLDIFQKDDMTFEEPTNMTKSITSSATNSSVTFDSHRSDGQKFGGTRKRRFSQYGKDTSGQHSSFGFRRKRLKSTPAEQIVLPTKFLLGGNINDPLNLNSMNDEEINKILNAKTPHSSPLPTPSHRQNVEVQIPTNINDPLNLNSTDDDGNLVKGINRKKKRLHKYKKKSEEGQNISVSSTGFKESEKRKGLMEALKIDIEEDETGESVDIQTPGGPSSGSDLEFSRSLKHDTSKIVSPVIPQISPGSWHKRRRRTMSMSDARPEPSSSVSRSILRTSLSPPRTFEIEKTSPTKRSFKRQFSQKQTSPQKFCKNPKFVYGNYNRYYGYRNPDLEDHRLESFRLDWFEGKDVLDIGCNVGHMTLTLAREMKPRKIIGIDIDPSLIAAARKNIRHYISNENLRGTFPVSNTVNYGPIAAPPVGSRKDLPKFPNNVAFVQGNYVLERDDLLELQKEDYDVIMALSLTKWIHLNFGDAGLKRMFKRIYKQLRPGGRLILEPQPWSSYKKKKKLTPEIHENFQKICLKPDQFSDYLLSKEVGFSTCEVIDVPFNKSKGFRRPIQMFRKTETAANSPKQDLKDSTSSGGSCATDSLKQDTMDSVKQDTMDSVKQDTTDSVKQDTTDSVKQDTTDTLKQDIADSMKQDTMDSVKQDTTDSVKQDTTDSVKQDTTDTLKQDIADSMKQDTTDSSKQNPTDLSSTAATDSSADHTLSTSSDNVVCSQICAKQNSDNSVRTSSDMLTSSEACEKQSSAKIINQT